MGGADSRPACLRPVLPSQGPGTGCPPERTGAQAAADARLGRSLGPRGQRLVQLPDPVPWPSCQALAAPHPQPAWAQASYLHSLCEATVPAGGWLGWGDPGRPAAASWGSHYGPSPSQQGGRWWLWAAGGLPFQPQSTCNWIHPCPPTLPRPHPLRAQTQLHKPPTQAWLCCPPQRPIFPPVPPRPPPCPILMLSLSHSPPS